MDGEEKLAIENSWYCFRFMVKINTQIFQEFQWTWSKILVVTKYFDPQHTIECIKQCEEFHGLILGFWENRIKQIQEKEIDREKIHFIGNIQSKDISNIVESCSCIHSVASEKHLQKIIDSAAIQNLYVWVYLQLCLDPLKNIWFSSDEIKDILTRHNENKYVTFLWISGMWKWEFSYDEKKQEFEKLIALKNDSFPNGKISAGTSRDYKIALQYKIDIIRMWKKLFD